MDSARRSHDRTQYQGKRLFYLLLAFLLPAGLLYLRLVLGLAATDTRIAPATSRTLAGWSVVALVLFFAAQVFGSLYVGRLMPPARTRWGKTLQAIAMFLLCLLVSLTVAISLEAFGFNVFLRAAGR